MIRPVKDCVVQDGHLQQVRLSRRWLIRVQVVEYQRSFLVGRVAWSSVGGLLIVSGALGLFRRDAIMKAGGVRVGSVGEDAELVVRLHRQGFGPPPPPLASPPPCPVVGPAPSDGPQPVRPYCLGGEDVRPVR